MNQNWDIQRLVRPHHKSARRILIFRCLIQHFEGPFISTLVVFLFQLYLLHSGIGSNLFFPEFEGFKPLWQYSLALEFLWLAYKYWPSMAWVTLASFLRHPSHVHISSCFPYDLFQWLTVSVWSYWDFLIYKHQQKLKFADWAEGGKQRKGHWRDKKGAFQGFLIWVYCLAPSHLDMI